MDAARLPVTTVDVAIVGSGIVGLGVAYAAVRRGLSVAVIDRAQRPGGASVRNFGHLCIGAQIGPARRHADRSRDLWLSLGAAAGFEVRRCGTIVAARHEDEMAVLAAAAADGGSDLLAHREVVAAAPLDPARGSGSARILPDLQVDPRTAAPSIADHLARRGVEFHRRTAGVAVRPGVLTTTRGDIHAGTIVVCVNHDLDHLLPEVAEDIGLLRCALDMLRVRADLRRPLTAPLLTGWSMLRYGRFAQQPLIAAVRARLHADRPDLAAVDVNQMYTQFPDGSLIVGDTHERAVDVDPFRAEAASRLLLAATEDLFGIPAPTVVERWTGVYASGPQPFVDRETQPGVIVLGVATGIGMTTGLGLAEERIGRIHGDLGVRDMSIPRSTRGAQ